MLKWFETLVVLGKLGCRPNVFNFMLIKWVFQNGGGMYWAEGEIAYFYSYGWGGSLLKAIVGKHFKKR